MDSFDDELLRLHPDTVMSVRKLYNLEKREDMDRAIDVLEDWLKKQQHLTRKEYPRDFLERSIIRVKGSVEKAKLQIDNLCSMRTLFPKFFEKCDAKNDFVDINSVLALSTVPTLTEDHYRLFVAIFQKNDIDNDTLMDCLRLGILKSEYVKAHDYCNGYIAIFDLRNVNLAELITTIDLMMLHQLIRIQIEGYGVRLKGFHALTSSKAVQIALNILKPMVGPKIADRIRVHTSMETLYDQVPRELLPLELGGSAESIVSIADKWLEVLSRKENVDYMREMKKAVSNEAYRIKEKLNNLDLGIAGTFRSLSVD